MSIIRTHRCLPWGLFFLKAVLTPRFSIIHSFHLSFVQFSTLYVSSVYSTCLFLIDALFTSNLFLSWERIFAATKQGISRVFRGFCLQGFQMYHRIAMELGGCVRSSVGEAFEELGGPQRGLGGPFVGRAQGKERKGRKHHLPMVNSIFRRTQKSEMYKVKLYELNE